MLLPNSFWRGLPAFVFLFLLQGGLRSAETRDRVDLGGNVAMELVEISPGVFQQGSKSTEIGRRPDEMMREVHISRKFYLGKYPVTRQQFSLFIAETGYRTEAEAGASGGFGWNGEALVQRKEYTWRNPGFSETDAHPVTIVTFGDAHAFLAWLSKKTGRAFSLPTEAQWEYACRAGTVTPWPSGEEAGAADELIWSKTTAGTGTRAVGKKAANPWGLYDMLGNVWEWCEDWFGPYEAGPVTDPVQKNSTLSDKPRRVLRGGSWLRDRNDCRSAARYRNDPGSRNCDNGFRVMTLDPGPVTAIPAVNSGLVRSIADSQMSPRAEESLAANERQVRTDSQILYRSKPFVSERFGMGMPVFIVILMAVVAVIRSLMGRGRIIGGNNYSGGPQMGGRFTTRLADDGFWIDGQSDSAGRQLLCRYDTGAGEQETQVLFQPGPNGQFVYTGGRPKNVTVISPGEVSSGGGSVIRNISQRQIIDDPLPRTYRNTGSAGGRPPAY